VLVARADLADDDADLVIFGHRRMEILYVGHGGRLERGFLQQPRVMAIDVAGVNAELAGFAGDLGHVLVSWCHNAPRPERIHPGVLLRSDRVAEVIVDDLT
jgi:hypothetical protein